MWSRQEIRKSDRRKINEFKKKSAVSAKPRLHMHQTENNLLAQTAYAALDLGTNNCRLLIARAPDMSQTNSDDISSDMQYPENENKDFEVVDAFSRIVRLGEGVSRSGKLSSAAMERTVDALRICARKMSRWNVTSARLVATQACRQAENNHEFLERVYYETGLLLETISPKEEAYLALAGCAPLLDRQSSNALVFDIGGGSTEISVLSLSEDDAPALQGWASIPVGVVTLTEKYGGNLVGKAIFEKMVAEVSEMLLDIQQNNPSLCLDCNRPLQLLGTSGTVTTLAGIHLALPRYNRNEVDGIFLSCQSVRHISEMLHDLDYEARAAIPCIGPDRADLVVSGCAILEAICRFWPAEHLRVADRGVREGILHTLMATKGQQSER